jgi:hypothetical protein
MISFNKEFLVRKFILLQKFNLTSCTDGGFLMFLIDFKDYDNPKSPFNVYLYFQEYLKYFYESVFSVDEESVVGVQILNPEENLSYRFKKKIIRTSLEIETGEIYRKEHPITGKPFFIEINKDNFEDIEQYHQALRTLYSTFKDKVETGVYVPKEFNIPNLRPMYHKRIYLK